MEQASAHFNGFPVKSFRTMYQCRFAVETQSCGAELPAVSHQLEPNIAGTPSPYRQKEISLKEEHFLYKHACLCGFLLSLQYH